MSEVSSQLQAMLDRGVALHLFSGAAAGISSRAGRVVVSSGTHADDDPTAVGRGSVFDLASVTKTFTAATAVRLAELGAVDLDMPVGEVVRVGSGDGAGDITLRMLLTHVSGLPAESMIWRDPDLSASERLDRLLLSPLESPPGALHRYSCVGYVAAGVFLEKATGATLPELVDDALARPLDLRSVAFGPVDAHSAVATEAQPWAGRGMLRGEVHDELSRSLGGQVGNAGLFADADDVLTFAETFLDDRLFASGSLESMSTDQLDARNGAPYGQALGPRVRDRDFLGDVDGFGHPGFTGTMWFVAPRQRLAATLLTNRVHPHRDNTDLADFRQRFAEWAVTASSAGE